MYRKRKSTKAYSPDASKKSYEKGDLACPFCTLDDRQVFLDGKKMRVVANLYPYDYWDYYRNVVDHRLLVPKRHVDSLADFTDEEKIEAMDVIADYESKGYSVYARAPQNSSRTVAHQHTHLIKVEGGGARFSLHLEKPYFVWKV